MADATSPAARRYCTESARVQEGQPSVYVLPLRKDPGAASRLQLGEGNLLVRHRVVMLIGATGSGKTTLLNRMVNYILGVQWEDPFRFKLIHEVTSGTQADSQTSDITAYVLNHQEGFQIPYSLTVIDTPGFGSTRGIEDDKLITEQIRVFFSSGGGADCIHAVCFVVQAPLARLTPSQKYVFDSLLSIFGKDIRDNIQVLTTFADAQMPPVLEAIKKADVPCAKDARGVPLYFAVNNSALFASNAPKGAGSTILDEIFWKMADNSMKIFFDSLDRLETRSLSLTKEVLRERKELETVLEGVQAQIQAGLANLEGLRETQLALAQHREDMAANQNFEFEVERTELGTEATDTYSNNCPTCQVTCCRDCQVPWVNFLSFCYAMDTLSGKCRVCPGHCDTARHSLQKFKYVRRAVRETRTYEELKRRYDSAAAEAMTAEEVLRRLREEYERARAAVAALIRRSAQSLRRLQAIALKPNPLSTPEYVDLLIASEEQERQPGYQGRIRALREVRKEAELIQKIAKKEPLLPEERGLRS